MHHGSAADIQVARGHALDAAYNANPRLFCHRRPTPPKMRTIAWINAYGLTVTSVLDLP